MYIESKLHEIDKILFSFDLSQIEGPKIISKELDIKTPCGLKLNCKIQLGNKFFIIDSEIENEKKITDIFRILGDYVQILYLGKGNSQLIYPEKRKAIESGSIQYCCDGDTVNHIEIPISSSTHYQGIFLAKDYYLQLLQNEKWAVNNPLLNKVKAGERVKIGSCKFPIDFRLHQLLNQISQNEWGDDFKEYFLELKFKELLLCLHLCEEEKLNTESSGVAAEHFEKIKAAHALLIENFKNPPTIKALARSVLLNELQLKNGFKKVYGKTIRSFIIELRMEKAKSLLGSCTVNEMAGALGYKSVPHFINTFKKHYGYTPKQSLNQ